MVTWLTIFPRIGRSVATTLIQDMLRQLGGMTGRIDLLPDTTITSPFEVSQIKNTFWGTPEVRSLYPGRPGDQLIEPSFSFAQQVRPVGNPIHRAFCESDCFT